MDLVLNVADHYVLTPYVYPSNWKEDDIYRQLISLYAITVVGGYLLYLSTTTFSYFFIFDKRLMQHPHFLKVSKPRKVRLDVYCTAYNGLFISYGHVAATLKWTYVFTLSFLADLQYAASDQDLHSLTLEQLLETSAGSKMDVQSFNFLLHIT